MSTICKTKIETEGALSLFTFDGEFTNGTWKVKNHGRTGALSCGDCFLWDEDDGDASRKHYIITEIVYRQTLEDDVENGEHDVNTTGIEICVTGIEICGSQTTQGCCPTHGDSERVADSEIYRLKSGYC